MKVRTTRVGLALIGAALALPGSAVAATYQVSAGAPPTAKMPKSFAAGLYDASSFYPSGHKTLQIRKGDKVTFSGGFHTATILGSSPRGALEFLVPDPTGGTYAPVNDASLVPTPFYWAGKPKFVYNFATFLPAGSTAVNSSTALYHSGVLFQYPKGYTLKFNKTGTYKLVCLLHPGMTGKIQVLARNKKVSSVAKVAKRAKAEVQADIRTASTIDLNLPRSLQDPAVPVVTVGAGNRHTALFAFYPQVLSVKTGTTVTFRSASVNEPHNVGIGELNYQFGLLQQVNLEPNGPTDPNQVNPFLFYGSDAPDAQGVRTFAGAATHGNGYLATPIVWKGAAPPITAETKVKFTAPGTYTYICQIHPNMVGTLNVHP